jgi:Uma2 family endonuclease
LFPSEDEDKIMVSTPQIHAMTVEEFEEYVLLPENADKHFEYIGGEVVEVTSYDLSSEVAMIIGSFLTVFIRQNKLGRVKGADGGYRIANERYSPDFGFTAQAKKPRPTGELYDSAPPDLVVEVLSPSNRERDMRIKIGNYVSVGAMVWLVDPEARRVEVYAPGQPVKVLGIGDTLDGGTVLPGFALPVKDIFPE